MRMSLLLLVVLAVWSAPVSRGQSPGTGGEGGNGGGNAPDWTFGCKRIYFENEYILVGQNPPARQHTGTYFEIADMVAEVNGMVPTHSRLFVLDASDNLKWNSVDLDVTQVGNTNRYELPDIGQTRISGPLTPPLFIRVDLKNAAGFWFSCPFRLQVGSSVEGTSCSGTKVGFWKFETRTSWTFLGLSPNTLPDFRVRLDVVNDPMNPWALFQRVWESPFNADGSFGWSVDDQLTTVGNGFRKNLGPPGAKFYAWGQSCIANQSENPWGILSAYHTKFVQGP